ncbi:MAG TPA: ribonuclease HI family protein [Bacillota bacterium]|nr:ribonuclease HI family protein [Bacillota bacterium]
MIEIYTDGASRGNPGKSGAGIYIKDKDKTMKYVAPLSEMTNHEAEFHAVITALNICKCKFAHNILSIRTDAKVVVDAMEKNYTGNENFKPLLQEINELKKHFPFVFIKWIPNKENIHADELAKLAIESQDLQKIE